MKTYEIILEDDDGNYVRTTLQKNGIFEVTRYINERYHDQIQITKIFVREVKGGR